MQRILFFANDPPSQILRQHANTTPLGTLSAPIVATIAAAPLFNYNLQRRRGGSSANQDCRTKKNVFQGYFMNVYFAEMGAPICSRTNV